MTQRISRALFDVVVAVTAAAAMPAGAGAAPAAAEPGEVRVTTVEPGPGPGRLTVRWDGPADVTGWTVAVLVPAGRTGSVYGEVLVPGSVREVVLECIPPLDAVDDFVNLT